MRHEEAAELLPVLALGALDAGEAAEAEEHVEHCVWCRRERRVWDETAAMIPRGELDAPPPSRLRARVLSAAVPRSRRLAPPAAVAAAALFAVSSAALAAAVVDLRADLEAARTELAVARVVGEMAAQARLARLDALAAAPGAGARVFFEPATRRAVLVVSGLPVPPAGKAYELWVIAGEAPVPAGVFRPDASGRAVMVLPALDATARVKTFAVTIEPDGGAPAPTGPMVLAGSV